MTADDSNGELVDQLKRVESDLTFRRRTRRRVIAIGVVVAFDLVVSVLSVAAFIGVHNQQDRSDAERQDRSRGSCVQFNINQANTREAQVQGLVNALRKLYGDSPQGTQFIDDLEPALRESVTALLPYRDCSDAGIDKFLKDPPQDPNAGG